MDVEENALGNPWEINLGTTYLENDIVNHHGATELMVCTIDEIPGAYWRKLGSEEVGEGCIPLPKGMTHIQDAAEELRLEGIVALWTGKRDIQSKT